LLFGQLYPSFYAKNYLTGEVIFGLFWKKQISEQRQEFKAVEVEVVFPSSFPKKILFYRFFCGKETYLFSQLKKKTFFLSIFKVQLTKICFCVKFTRPVYTKDTILE
jgi:hypothetical protein